MIFNILRAIVTVFLVVVAFFVLGAVLSFLIKLAFFILLVAVAYYLYQRGSRNRWDRRTYKRNR